MGGNTMSLAQEMTAYTSAAASGHSGTVPVEVNEDTPVRQCRVLGEDHPDLMLPVPEFAMDKNEDGPEDKPEDDEGPDPWDERMQPEDMPHAEPEDMPYGLLSR